MRGIGKAIWPAVGVLFGLLLFAGGVAGFVNRGQVETALQGPEARWVLFYPTGAFGACARIGRVQTCSATPTGNINADGRVVARSVPLMADGQEFRWTVSPDAVQAANRRSRARYLACAASGRTDCADPEYLTPSWNSGMRVRWAPAAQGAYPPGAEPGGTDSLTIAIFLVVAGGLVTGASGLWLSGVIRRQRAA
jgi:hypothetical protein